jgi:murein L,D-transpeptidase YcbB/YkuD
LPQFFRRSPVAKAISGFQRGDPRSFSQHGYSLKRRAPYNDRAGSSHSKAALAFVLLLLAGCHTSNHAGPVATHVDLTPQQLAVQADARSRHLDLLHWSDFTDVREPVDAFYAGRTWDLAWIHGQKATSQAIALTHVFASSSDKGLQPDDYDAAVWQQRLHDLKHADAQQRAAFDVEMTVCAMRYLSALHLGRVNPAHFNYGINIDEKKIDLAGFLSQKVIETGDLTGALAELEPTSAMYRNTLEALHQYQAMEVKEVGDGTHGANELLPIPAKPIGIGSAYSGASALASRLTLLGDLPGESAGPVSADSVSKSYTAALAEGVKNFQNRHDLTPSGTLTPATVAALNVPLTTRVNELKDTLERVRWLAPEYQDAPVFVNIPEYLLRVYGDNHTLAFQMRVVVGQAKVDDHKTPMIAQKMRYVVLRPFWNVTPTIVKEELVPHVEADKGYLEAKNFEVVDRRGKPVTNWTTEELAKNLFMVREKPGPTNSLGLVKFMFPNKQNIYLHSTPAVQLFARSRRDYSHGCVRIQEPEQMADWVLRDQPKWTPDVIHDAMENGEDNKTVGLMHPIPVLIFYATARVADDGKVHFFNDLYGYDADLEGLLAKGPPYPIKPDPKPKPKGDEGDTA